MIDRKQLREALSPENIISLMQLLGCSQFEDKGSYIQFKTICHNVNEDAAGYNLSYYKESKRFYCFSNCHSMDIFQVVKNRWELLDNGEDTHFDSLADWVLTHSKIDLDSCQPTFKSPINPRDYQNKTQEVILPEKPSEVLASFTKYYCIEWLNDGISKEAMDVYGIKYSIGRNAIIIPHYDVHGRLVGIRRRALNHEDIEKGKYKPIYVEGNSYAHPLGYNLYGLNIVKDEIARQKRVIIAEGEKAALQGYTLWGDKNIVVSACGSRINRWQVHLLLKYCQPNEIIIAFDKGLEEENIRKMCEKYSGYCDFSYLSDVGNELKDKESPLDRPDLIDKLLQRRVPVS